MADALLNGDVGGDDDVFVYMGGEQRVPHDVSRAKIDESVDTITANAFFNRTELIEVKGHSKLKKIEHGTFQWCRRLRRLMNMNGVQEIEQWAFNGCEALSDMEFDKLEIIGGGAFSSCKSLRSINLPSIRRVEQCAFELCEQFTDVVFGKDLERIEECAFIECHVLGRIAIPLKDDLIVEDDIIDENSDPFNRCDSLSRVDIIGGIHKTISSLHMESWKVEMKLEIDRINQELPNISRYSKTLAIQSWIRSVLGRMEHYKIEHKVLVKEAMALLELALWKVKLDGEGKCNPEEEGMKPKKAKIDKESARKEHRVTCGASIVIKNVLPFLALK
jgi:hypothetical protein